MHRILSVIAIAAISSMAAAQSFNIDLDKNSAAGGGIPGGAFPGAAGQPDYWNAVFPSSNANWGLIPVGGGATTVTLDVHGTPGTATTIPGASLDYSRIMADYDVVYFPQSSIDYAFLGLDPGLYRLCVYAYLPDTQGWYLDQFNVKTYYTNYLGVYVGNALVGAGTTSGEAPPNEFIAGVTHVFFNFTVGAGAPPVKIVASTGSSTHERCALNAFQLMKYTGTRLYVNDNAAGLNNGTSWTNAFRSLTDALALAGKSNGQITEIWVAGGTYKPAAALRGASFVIPSGVKIYGGFAGSETSLLQRPPIGNVPSILSGDIGTAGSLSDNSYHVVNANNTNYLTRLDGFTITSGYANGGGSNDDGAAMYIDNGQLEVRNCLFRDCEAAGEGGFVYQTNNAHPKFVNCDFVDGYAVSFGGAIRNNTGSADFEAVNCRFISNYSETNGGAINSTSGFLQLYNCVFDGNFSGGYGGGLLIWGAGATAFVTNSTFWNNGASTYGGIAVMYSAAATIRNTALHSNPDLNGSTSVQDANVGTTSGSFTISYSLVGGWTGSHAGTGVFDAAPQFVDANGADNVAGTLDDDFRPAAGSYLIDRGSVDALPSDDADIDGDNNKIERLPLDQAGNPRRVDDPSLTDYGQGTAPIVDIGAYEFQPVLCNPCDANCNGTVNQFDILPFVTAVATHNACSPCAGDINGDGTTNTFDINGFINCLNP